MRSSSKRSIAIAAGACLLGLLLIGGPGTFAFLKASKTGTAVSLNSGSLTTGVTGPTIGTAVIGTSTNGVVARPGSSGMVPGLQSETLSYVVANSGSARVPASLAVSIATTAITNTTVTPFVSATVSVNGGTAVVLAAASASGVNGAVSTGVTVQPGAAATVLIAFSIPATSGATDLARSLQANSSTSLSLASIFTATPTFTLTQVAIGP